MSKGDSTRSRILEQALVLASRLGLSGLTLGVLAETLGLSKSGLFAHFRSKEALVLALFEYTSRRFVEHAEPYTRNREPGLDELRGELEAWLDWIALPTLPAGCPIMGASFECEDVEGPVRDRVVEVTLGSRRRIAQMLERAIQRGELSSQMDVEQALFEIRGITLSFHLEYRLLKEPNARTRANLALSGLIERYRVPPKTVTASRPRGLSK